MEYSLDASDYVDVSGFDDFEMILAAADVLITDYSGCFYDFSLSGNPIFFYQPDYSEMKTDRDFYVEPEQMPYPVAHDMDNLIENIKHFDEERYSKELCVFMKQFGNYDDGHASERVCERMCSIIAEGDQR